MPSTTPPLRRLLRSLHPHRRLVWLAASCSVLNKLFDLAPPVLIGLAVDVVVQQNTSWLAAFGITSVPGQLGVLAALSFVIWSAESLFEYLYALLWRWMWWCSRTPPGWRPSGSPRCPGSWGCWRRSPL